MGTGVTVDSDRERRRVPQGHLPADGSAHEGKPPWPTDPRGRRAPDPWDDPWIASILYSDAMLLLISAVEREARRRLLLRLTLRWVACAYV